MRLSSLATVLLALLLLALPGSARAQEVNLRNANLYVEHADLKLQRPGIPLELVRYYNSRSAERGAFGFGWSTNLDIVCQPGPDGSILVTDADGFVLRYTLNGEPKERVRARYVDSLVQARRNQDIAAGTERSDAFYEKMRADLLADDELRRRVGQVLQSGWIEPQVGAYMSFDRGTERLEKRKDGTYVRTRADGTRYTFDKRGRLRRMTDPAGRGLRLDYDRDGRLTKVSHSEGGSISLDWDGRHVVALLDTEGRRVEYTYQGDDLVRVKGPGDRRWAYTYDAEHDLLAARKPDGSGFQVAYDVERDWVTAVKVGEEVTRYQWFLTDAHHYGVTVTHPDGSWERHTYDDAEHRHVVERSDGTRTETLLSACCDKPLQVKDEQGRITRYDYDRQARLVGIEYPDGLLVRYAYHPKWSRVVQAMFSDGRRYQYTYDDAGNLVQVRDAQGHRLDLEYGPNGKVSRIVDEAGAVYTFRYDVEGRPVEIRKGSEGALAIHYGPVGEVKSTEISAGDASRAAFYADLRRVLSMLEPATAQGR